MPSTSPSTPLRRSPPRGSQRSGGRSRLTPFDMEANLTEVLAQHGPGVYAVVVWWSDDATGDFLTLAEYSIFYRVDPPETYGSA